MFTADDQITDFYYGTISRETPPSGGTLKTKVAAGGAADSFVSGISPTWGNCSLCVNYSGRGSRLVLSGTVYTYTNANGDVYTFDQFSGVSGIGNGTVGRLTNITYANGVVITIKYDDYSTSCTAKSFVKLLKKKRKIGSHVYKIYPFVFNSDNRYSCPGREA